MRKRSQLGLMPQWLHNEQRLKDIRDAIDRFKNNNQHIPQTWISEEQEINSWFKNRKKNLKDIPQTYLT